MQISISSLERDFTMLVDVFSPGFLGSSSKVRLCFVRAAVRSSLRMDISSLDFRQGGGADRFAGSTILKSNENIAGLLTA